MMGRRPLGNAWDVSWRFLLLMTGWGMVISPFFVVVMPRLQARGLADLPVTWLLIETVLALAATGAVLVMNRYVDRQAIDALGLAAGGALRHFARGIALGAAIMGTAVGVLLALGIARRLPLASVPVLTLGVASVATLVNAFTQEILFQGYLLPSILRRSTPRIALVASAVVFVLIHGPAAFLDPFPGLNLFLAALLLGSARLRTNGLWLGLGIHFGWNFVEGPLLGLLVSGHELQGWKVLELAGPSYLSGGTFGPEGSIVATVLTLAGLGVVWRLRLEVQRAPGPESSQP